MHHRRPRREKKKKKKEIDRIGILSMRAPSEGEATKADAIKSSECIANAEITNA